MYRIYFVVDLQRKNYLQRFTIINNIYNDIILHNNKYRKYINLSCYLNKLNIYIDYNIIYNLYIFRKYYIYIYIYIS